MKEDFARVLRHLQEYIGRAELAEEISRAKKGYFEQIGSPREGEAFLEMRLTSFIEWFIFDRKIDRKNMTPVALFLKERSEQLTDQEKELLESLRNSVHSLFKVKKKKDGKAVIRDLFSGKKYKNVEGLPPSLSKGDVAEARIVPMPGGGFHFTDAYCYHPPRSHRFLVQELKRARKNGDDLEGLLRQFMSMSSKWERYPRMKLAEIYKWRQ